MGFLEVILIAISLAMDAFAVAIGVGTSGRAPGWRPAVRLAFHFGLFQFLMPVLGWYVGVRIEKALEEYDHWVAFALLASVGAHMLYEAFLEDNEASPKDPTRGMSLVALSVATSIDALAVGLSLGMLKVQIWYPSVVIGIVTAGLSWLGVQLGGRLRGRTGKRMECVGGIVLILIGLRILFTHGAG